MKKVYLFLILFTLLLAACGTKKDSAPRPETPKVTDPQTPIAVKAGEEFTITVESAGQASELHWEVAIALDTKVVDYVWKDFVPKTASENSSGWDVWKFKAVAPGTTTITLGYYRGLTEDTAKLVVFTIVVE